MTTTDLLRQLAYRVLSFPNLDVSDDLADLCSGLDSYERGEAFRRLVTAVVDKDETALDAALAELTGVPA